MQTSAGRTSEAQIHQKKRMQNHKKRNRKKSIHFLWKYHEERPFFKNSSLNIAGHFRFLLVLENQQRKEAGIDNVQYFWGWDLDGNGKGCILGPRQLHHSRQLPLIHILPYSRQKSHFLFNSSLCGTCDMDGVHFTQWHTHYELHRPYFNKPATSGKRPRWMLKLHPEETQRHTFATVFL